MKKVFSLILILVLICSLSVTAFADCAGGQACTCCGCNGNGTCGNTSNSGNCGSSTNCGGSTNCTVKITRQPKEETSLNNERYSTYFLVYADNAVAYEWFCKIGRDGEVMRVRDAICEYGLRAEGYDTNKLWLYSNCSNGWEGINGWWWMCKAYDCSGCAVSSDWVATATVANVCCAPPVCAPAPCTGIAVAPSCAAPAAPACSGYGYGCGGYGYLETYYDSTTTTETTISQHGYHIQPW